MTGPLAILQGAPWWVFPLLALLIWLGALALRPRTVALPRVFIAPAVFIGWGLVSLVTRSSASPLIPLDWLATAACGAVLAFATTRFDGLRADRDHRLVHLPASWLPLARNVLIFGAKFLLGAAMAMRPESRDQLLLWDIAVSGASAGYFLGWALRFALSYRQASAVDLLAASRPGVA
jgi:hypothetical protein